MNTYAFLREFAGSWMLIAMMLFYISACLWVLSPKRRAANADAAQIPFRNETLDTARNEEPDQDERPGKGLDTSRAKSAALPKKESV